MMNTVVLKVTGWELLSPFGDKAALCRALDDSPGAVPARRFAGATEEGEHTHVVPDFDVREQLGKKGTRAFDRHTGLFVKAASNALAESGLAGDALASSAVINGTAAGSLSSILDFLLDTYRNERPYFVNPAHMPNTVLNCAGSQCAIWHGIKGPNATVSAGAQSFFAALRMAGQWAKLGYAGQFLVGAVEEITPISADLIDSYRHRTGYLGCFAEGGAVFVCEARDRTACGEDDDLVLATQMGTDIGATGGFERMVLAMLRRAGVEPGQVAHVVTKSPKWTSSAATEAAVVRKLGGSHGNAYDVFGHGYSVSGAMQLALLLRTLRQGEHGVALSASRNGSIGATLVRKGNRA